MSNDSPRIILVRPEEAGNVGAAARVMRNFGMDRLVLVRPRLARLQEGFKWARGAEDLLEGAEVHDTLEDALRGCTRAWATTRRRGRWRGRYESPRDAARETRERAGLGEETAWVFGPESRGLSTDEVALCSARITIPTHSRQPSLNLAQAIALCCYELALATGPESVDSPRRLAPIEDREALYRHLERGLLEIGFLHPHTARARMHLLKEALERARLDPREVRLFRGLARQAEWAGRHVPEEVKRGDSGED